MYPQCFVCPPQILRLGLIKTNLVGMMASCSLEHFYIYLQVNTISKKQLNLKGFYEWEEQS